MSIKLFINKPPAYKTLQCFLPYPYKMIVFVVTVSQCLRRGWGGQLEGDAPYSNFFPLRLLSHLEKVTSTNLLSLEKNSAYFRPDQNLSNKTTEGRVALLLWNTSFSNPVLLSSRGLS